MLMHEARFLLARVSAKNLRGRSESTRNPYSVPFCSSSLCDRGKIGLIALHLNIMKLFLCYIR